MQLFLLIQDWDTGDYFLQGVFKENSEELSKLTLDLCSRDVSYQVIKGERIESWISPEWDCPYHNRRF